MNEILFPVLSYFLSDYKVLYSSCVKILWTWMRYKRSEKKLGPLYDCKCLQRENTEFVQVKFLLWDERVNENETKKEWTAELVACKQV